MEEYKAEFMDIELYERYWPHIEEQLNLVPQIWAPYFTKEYLRSALDEKECFVWGVGTETELRLVIWGRVLEFPASRVLQIFLAIGNDIDGCLPALEGSLEKIANTTGCSWCEVIGRPGWERKLKGFKRTAVVLQKPLTHFRVQ